MNDNDIIKALEYCISFVSGSCEKCPYRKHRPRCIEKRNAYIADLINRQKAEIERLNHIRAELSKENDRLYESNKTARAEAIKEFAEKLKESLDGRTEPVDDYDIDELAREIRRNIMASCKECIHNSVCSLWRREEGQDAKFYAETEDGKCEYFADKSRYIEIPTEPEQKKSVSMMIWEMLTRAE